MCPLVTENQWANLYSLSYTVDQRNKNTIIFRSHPEIGTNKKNNAYIYMHDKYSHWCMSLSPYRLV